MPHAIEGCFLSASLKDLFPFCNLDLFLCGKLFGPLLSLFTIYALKGKAYVSSSQFCIHCVYHGDYIQEVFAKYLLATLINTIIS